MAMTTTEQLVTDAVDVELRLGGLLPDVEAAILEPVLDVPRPEAAFYLWAHTPVDDETFTRGLFEAWNVVALPGSYLSRPGPDGRSPGADHIRLSLVAPLERCVEAAERIRDFCHTL